MNQLKIDAQHSSRQRAIARFVGGITKWHQSEEGMMSFVSLVVLLFLVVLIGLVGNIGYTITRKLEVQNSADAVAYTSAIWQARGMNVITATNHLMGEMQSLVVLHDAIGGEELEGKKPLDPAEAKQAQDKLDRATTELDVAWDVLRLAGVFTPAYPGPYPDQKVGERVKSGATVRAAMTDLKRALIVVYITRAGARLLEMTPAAEIGVAIDLAALGIEYMILAEYIVLKTMESFAENTTTFRDLLFETLLPNASDFERSVVENVPRYAARAAKAIAEKNGTAGGIYPSEPPLPVLRDRPRDGKIDDSKLPRSALVRSTYPWVIYDRTPVLKLTAWMIFSQTRKHYLFYTDHYTLLKSKELYNSADRDFTMYLMTKPDESKGSEPWTNDSRLANKKFTLVGFAHRPSRTLFSPAVYKVPNGNGMVGCAQAIFYNANSQNPSNGPPTFQPEVGWDTLNWEPPVTGSGAYEFNLGPEETHDCPRIKLNWQAKLVPVTRLGEAAKSGEVESPIQPVLERMGSNSDRLQSH